MLKQDKIYKDELLRIRNKYRDEFEKVIEVLNGIINGIGVTTVKCPHCKKSHPVEVTKDKDRIDASNKLARMLGWIAPAERVIQDPGTNKPSGEKKSPMSAEQKKKLAEILNEKTEASAVTFS